MYKKSVLLILSLGILFLSGCATKSSERLALTVTVTPTLTSTETPASTPFREYERTERTLRLAEPNAIRIAEVQDAVIYHGSYADYYMSSALDEKEKVQYVDSAELILEVLSGYVTEMPRLMVYDGEGMYYYCTEKKQCLLDAKYAGTSVQAAILLQAVLDSATVNYGLL